MFFNLSREFDTRFPQHAHVAGLWFNFDNGWQHNGETFYKGYGHGEVGNYLEMSYTPNSINIVTPKIRSCPLYINFEQTQITNLEGEVRLHNDQTVVINDKKIGIIPRQFDYVWPTVNQSLEKVCDDVIACLSHQLMQLFEQYPFTHKCCFVSGGIDTVLLAALIEYHQADVEIIDYEHFEYDYFSNQVLDLLRKNWAYTQIHHWRKETILVSGAMGDEFMFRGPRCISQWARLKNLALLNLLEQAPYYHQRYFLQPENLVYFKDKSATSYATIIDQLLNDYQHWHIGNTLTWTPFLHVDILMAVLSMSAEDLVQQALDAKLSKMIIEKLAPRYLQYISTYKNYDTRQYLCNITTAV